MYICPRCDKQYPKAPEQCEQCKRPLILNKRFQIEISIQEGPAGEDFDVVDLKTNEPAILRELRVRKADMGSHNADIERYKENRSRISGMKYEGKKVLLDAFEAEYKNSVCYYFAFDADAWAGLGDDLYLGGGGGGDDDDDLPAIEGRDIDPELAALLAGLEARAEGDDGDKKASKSKSDDGGGALVKAEKDAPIAKKDAGGSAVATKAKAVIAASALVIIAVILAALFLL